MLNRNIEIWKDMVGYEGQYQVSNFGAIRSIVDNHGRSRMHIKSVFLRGAGYCYVNLSVKDVCYIEAVHRAVAKAFIQNPESKPQVNHKDGDKLNNNVWNLEWVTCSENHKHAIAAGLRSMEPLRLKNIGAKKGSAKSEYHNVSWDSARKKMEG